MTSASLQTGCSREHADDRVDAVAPRIADADARLEAFEVAARLAAIVESSQDAIIGKTLDGVITSWNTGAERMYGYSAAEVIGHSISELVPADRSGEVEPIIQRVARGESVQPFETQRVAKDGSTLDMSVAISAIRDEHGAVTGTSTVARDITDIRRAMAYRRTLETQLQQAQRLESLGQLAGGVAHDFNNLLAGIMNYSGLVSAALQDDMNRLGLCDDESMNTILGDVAQITKVAKRAADLTRQLLIFSRREVLRPQVLDLNAVVREMEGLVRHTIGQNVDHVETVLGEGPPFVTMDRGEIEQVIMNLSVNARDAMPEGGRLSIQTSVVEIDGNGTFGCDVAPGVFVRMSVSDTGTGMSQEVASRAFEPFFTTKVTGEGTGLGLATVFGIVSQAGGEVSIISELGQGTTVRIDLPAALETTPTPRSAQPPASSPAHGETILLVEDEEMVRDPARRILQRSATRCSRRATPLMRWRSCVVIQP